MNLIPSLRPKYTGEQIQSASRGQNLDQLKDILTLYAIPGQRIYDFTWGKGAMWDMQTLGKYKVCASDIDEDKVAAGASEWSHLASFCVADFTDPRLYDDGSGDVVILDPPYIAGKQTHESLHEAYANDNENHNAVLRLYMGGILNAYRVLRYGGRLIVKCQDELSGGKQEWTCDEVKEIMRLVGFDVVDLFILVNESGALMSGHKHQLSARKNHSYWIVGMKPFARPTRRKQGPRESKKKVGGIVFDRSIGSQ